MLQLASATKSHVEVLGPLVTVKVLSARLDYHMTSLVCFGTTQPKALPMHTMARNACARPDQHFLRLRAEHAKVQ